MSTLWHAMTPEAALKKLAVRAAGLSEKEVKDRRRVHGANILPEAKRDSILGLFLSQFHTPLMYIVLGMLAVTVLLGQTLNALFILFVVLINTSVGFFQEYKANQAIAKLRRLVRYRVRVRRDEAEHEVPAEGVVVGDILLLYPGTRVPADARLLKSEGLRVNEATLTGEPFAEPKNPAPLPEATAFADRENMVWMGSHAEEGIGEAVVVATGVETAYGKIVETLQKAEEGKTPLQKKLLALSKLLGAGILGLIAVIATVGYLRGEPFAEVFVASLALAVSAIPEGLLPAITVVLVLAMRRLLKQHALVRKLVANETLGSATVICTDKTGTLTEGEMKVSHIWTPEDGPEAEHLALKIAMLVSEAVVENPESELRDWVIHGRPTDRALLLVGLEAGFRPAELEKDMPRLRRIPFDARRRYAASVHRVEGREWMLFLGAPEVILEMSNMDALLEKKLEEFFKKGLRVIAAAYQDLPAGNVHLVGFIALKDPVRPEVKSALDDTFRAGIRPVIVTGDHRLTALAVAQELGLSFHEKEVIDGADLERLPEPEFRERVETFRLFARVAPDQKTRIVEALQAKGHVVAMIGDGVNDAPALQVADIGVAVEDGSDVAKEVADVVLLDNNYRTIVKAVEQGRLVFENIRRILLYLVADDFSEIFLFLTAFAFGLPLPLLPAQILWINIVEDGFPAAALTTEADTRGLLREPPRKPNEPIFHPPLRKWAAAIFLISGLAAFFTFLFFLAVTQDIEQTRTVTFALIAFDSLVFSFIVRSFHRSVFRRDLFSNRYLVGAAVFGVVLLLAAVYLAPLQAILGAVPLGLWAWVAILGVSFAELLLLEWTKRRFFVKLTAAS
ncbi:cation-transporting P-type ATPase [Candidatus Azambacteria bacterium]|nr:cation-transporting P-type ATPase [Candidatus Azambacteria bacterium]